jgi:hypothetical protein
MLGHQYGNAALNDFSIAQYGIAFKGGQYVRNMKIRILIDLKGIELPGVISHYRHKFFEIEREYHICLKVLKSLTGDARLS